VRPLRDLTAVRRCLDLTLKLVHSLTRVLGSSTIWLDWIGRNEAPILQMVYTGLKYAGSGVAARQALLPYLVPIRS
jgi:hypothetical protein